MANEQGKKTVSEHMKQILMLAAVGAAISLGKLLSGNDPLTWRVAVGRTILGSATSLVAGVVLVQIPDISPLALLGIGSALGIAGAQAVEALVRRFGGGTGGSA